MTLDTQPDLQYSLLEFVAHLTSEQYDKVPEDLIKLDFLKAERLDTVVASGFLEPLTYILKQAKEGGGGKKVRERIFDEYREKYPGLSDEELRYAMRDDMQQQIEKAREKASAVTGITMEVEELQKKNRDAFRIPEWFLYTSRAFLTLEGICLQADEDYSIIQSCFPYIARRLLNDDDPRAEQALKELIYGTQNGREGGVDVSSLSDLVDGFSTYTSTQKSVSANGKSRNSLVDTETAITLAKDGADIVLSSEGNFVQNLLVDESAAATSAQIKDSLRELLIEQPNRIRKSLPLNLGSLLPEPPSSQLNPFLEKTKDEENAQMLLNKISSALPGLSQIDSQMKNGDDTDQPFDLSKVDPEQVAVISRELRLNLPKYGPLLSQLGGKYVATVLERATDDIDQTLAKTPSKSLDSDLVGTIVDNAAKSVSETASRGAQAIRAQ